MGEIKRVRTLASRASILDGCDNRLAVGRIGDLDLLTAERRVHPIDLDGYNLRGIGENVAARSSAAHLIVECRLTAGNETAVR